MTGSQTPLNARKILAASWLVAYAACAVEAKPPAPPPPEPGFWLTGVAPNSFQGAVTALTQDGMVGAGLSFTNAPVYQVGFTWTRSGGRSDFGLLPGMPKVTDVSGISDANTVVGFMSDGVNSNTVRAFRWTGSGPLQDLGVLPGETRSFARGICGDGSVVVGHAEHGSMSFYTGQAFRWTAAKGMEALGKLTPGSLLSAANAVSRDGATIVGENMNELLNRSAFVWTESAGMKELPSLTGGLTTADGVNKDGSIIVGRSAALDGNARMVRWHNGVIEDLTGNSNLGPGSRGYAVSDDGSVVVGALGGLAIAWTNETGCLTAADYLALRGVSVPPDYMLYAVYAISGDGLTMGGVAVNLALGKAEGFVATIPGSVCTVDCDASGTLDIDDFICFQTRFAIADPYADCDESGELDIDDFICFQTLFAVGC